MVCILTESQKSRIYIWAGNIDLHHINRFVCQPFYYCQIFFRCMATYIDNDFCIILFQKKQVAKGAFL